MSEERSMIVVSGPAGVGKTTVSRLVAAEFDRSVHLDTADFMAAIVSGWVDPNDPAASSQHEAVGGALAVSAMGFAGDGYTTVVDGHLFPDGVAGLAAACSARGLECHYVVLDADLETHCTRGSARWTSIRDASSTRRVRRMTCATRCSSRSGRARWRSRLRDSSSSTTRNGSANQS